jgi:hypothetical protein
MPDRMWQAVVPPELICKVICLSCFDVFAHTRGIDYSADLKTLYFVGDKFSVEFRAGSVSVNDSSP